MWKYAVDSMECFRRFYGNLPLIPWEVSVDSMENLPSIIGKFPQNRAEQFLTNVLIGSI